MTRVAVALADGGWRQDDTHHWACDSHVGQLKGDGAGVSHDAGSDLYQLELQAEQRPVRNGLGQIDAAQEGGQGVGERVQLQPDLVVAEPPARQARLVEGLFPFLDMLLGGAALAVKAHQPNPAPWAGWRP